MSGNMAGTEWYRLVLPLGGEMNDQQPRRSLLGADSGLAKRNRGKILAVAATVVALLGIAWFIFWFILYREEGPAVSTALPQVQLTPTTITRVDIWGDYPKLSQAQARELRGKPNVINVALLGGGATYLQEAIVFDPAQPGSWQKESLPLGVSALSVKGTGFEVTVDGQTYTLNLFQVFAREGSGTLYVVDGNGQIWTNQLENVALVPTDEAAKTLPVQIEPNGSLSLTI